MPLLLAWIPALISWLFNAIRIYLASTFILNIIKMVGFLTVTYAIVSYVFGGFITSIVDFIGESLAYSKPVIDSLSLFLPSNFETCVYIIISVYILSFVFSWKDRIIKAFMGA